LNIVDAISLINYFMSYLYSLNVVFLMSIMTCSKPAFLKNESLAPALLVEYLYVLTT